MPENILALVAIISLSGCVAIPRIEIPDALTFDYEMPSQQPMSYSDLLCCYECNA